MPKLSPLDKIAAKRELLAVRTARITGVSVDGARALLRTERQQSLRLNPLVAPPQSTLRQLSTAGWRGRPYPWAMNCYSIDSDVGAVRDHKTVMNGAAFIQNAASWLPVLALGPQPDETILDICAAPGGKASHIAAITGNKAPLTVNDNSRARLAKMQANFKRLGVMAAAVTLYDATQLARKLEGQQFDKILLDAPCSGEGMLRYDSDKDMATWSVAHIKRLQQLQKRLLTQAWQLLKPSGTLVYSTCTMAPEENEAVIDYLLRTHQDATIQPLTINLPNQVPTVKEWNGKQYNTAVTGCLRLAPSPAIEAFFVCTLQKTVALDPYK